MSQFRFTIIDYTVNPAGDSTVIEEPAGWDGIVLKLKRHPEWHGFFDYFDNAISAFQFDGEGFSILQDAYVLLGVEAQLELLIEFACSETDAFEELYTGHFDFNTYTENCGDRCYIEINVETTSCLVQFKNRYDQKVNIESLRTFDLPEGDADDLAAYAGIGFEQTLLPSQIFLRTFYQMTAGNVFNFSDPLVVLLGDACSHIYTFALDIPVETTLPSFAGITDNYDVLNSVPPSPLANFITNGYPIFELQELSKLACYGEFNISVHVNGQFTEDTNSDRGYGSQFVLLRVEPDGTITVLDTQVIDAGSSYSGGVPNVEAFDKTATATTVLNEGDKIYFYLFLSNYTYLTSPDPFTLEVIFDIFDFEISGLTECEETQAKVCLINETASRVTEIITGDCLRVYSDLYGRTDAEPYVSAADGCGSLRVLSNGLWIRQAVQTDDTEPEYTVSMQEIFEGLNAIDCIGMGVEDDPNRLGFEMLRIEKFQYFYDTAVLLTFNGVANVKKQVDPSQVFSTFIGGFGKYETETAGGLNDIHTSRNFRTTLSTIKNALTQICPFIASGHSIEITRWQVGATSQDWRYDTDSFIVCVKRDAGEPSGYIVQRGEDMPTADNLPNWETAYNVLISPQRNARRWMPIIVQCFVDYVNATVKFMDGDGNLIASTFIPATSVECITQDDTVPWVNMPENADISLSASADYPFDADNVGDFYPIKKAELVTFEFPLSFQQWKTIKANPRGLIEYECGGVLNAGWIEEINYNIVDGLAEFVLIPQIVPPLAEGYGG